MAESASSVSNILETAAPSSPPPSIGGLDAKVVISKGFSLSLYLIAIIVFLLVFVVGLYLAYKNFSNILKRSNDNIGMKNIGNVLKVLITESNFKTTEDIVSFLSVLRSIYISPSNHKAFIVLVNDTGVVLLDTFSNQASLPTSRKIDFLEDLQKAATMDGFLQFYLQSKSIPCTGYVEWLEKEKVFVIIARS